MMDKKKSSPIDLLAIMAIPRQKHPRNGPRADAEFATQARSIDGDEHTRHFRDRECASENLRRRQNVGARYVAALVELRSSGPRMGLSSPYGAPTFEAD
jgi:hypothetical protein